MYMKEIYVEIGQNVKQGDIVGTLGQSGRATGPHLDVRLNWFNVKLDPFTILNLKNNENLKIFSINILILLLTIYL